MGEEDLYLLALRSIPKVGDVVAKQLISYCGSSKAVFEETKGKLQKIPSIGAKTIELIASQKSLDLAEEQIRLCEKNDVFLIPYYSSDYPEKLKWVNDAPLVLFVKGEKSHANQKVIGIVGTRNATNYGKEITRQIVQDLVAHDVLVVSGLAYGIDIAAHRAALEYGLPTVAVLAGGLEKVYPAAHRKTAQDILENGSIYSEKEIGIKPEAHFFPARNRIIAGMSDAVIVVEAAAKGGALITANIAYSYDREVFAVPGDLKNKFSEGCNWLIKSQRANIYTGLSDLEYLLNWEKGKEIETKVKLDFSQYSNDEQTILNILKEFKAGLHLDELSWKSQLSVNAAVSLLLNLEFAGLIKSLPGKKYQLIQ